MDHSTERRNTLIKKKSMAEISVPSAFAVLVEVPGVLWDDSTEF